MNRGEVIRRRVQAMLRGWLITSLAISILCYTFDHVQHATFWAIMALLAIAGLSSIAGWTKEL